jgi:aryl-alcohol dehydrogenase-like predicted oxidoreductase
MRKTFVFGGIGLSQLMLGTAQFGMPYGIANKTGKPSYESVRDIVRCAYEGGINCFDTAAAYGSSEEVLAKALSELGITDVVTVVTKVPRIPCDLSTAREIDDFVEASVKRSLERLGLPCLSFCFMHSEEDFIHAESLLKLKDSGLVEHVGFSVMTPDAARKIIASGFAEAVQLPTSILDHRFLRDRVFDSAEKSGMALFARSVFLQGLLLMAESEIHGRLRDVTPFTSKLRQIGEDAGMSLSQLALRYVLSLNGLTCAVIGAESIDQVRENLRAFEDGPLDKALMSAVEAAVPGLPDDILMPTAWRKETGSENR